MFVAALIALVGLGALVLGALQLAGMLPTARRTPAVSAYTNMAVGVVLIVLAILRLQHLV